MHIILFKAVLDSYYTKNNCIFADTAKRGRPQRGSGVGAGPSAEGPMELWGHNQVLQKRITDVKILSPTGVAVYK